MNCDRCKTETNTTKMSWFNTDIICAACQYEEEQHPLFEQAKAVELKELRKGNTNFPGLFGDKPWVEIKKM